MAKTVFDADIKLKVSDILPKIASGEVIEAEIPVALCKNKKSLEEWNKTSATALKIKKDGQEIYVPFLACKKQNCRTIYSWFSYDEKTKNWTNNSVKAKFLSHTCSNLDQPAVNFNIKLKKLNENIKQYYMDGLVKIHSDNLSCSVMAFSDITKQHAALLSRVEKFKTKDQLYKYDFENGYGRMAYISNVMSKARTIQQENIQILSGIHKNFKNYAYCIEFDFWTYRFGTRPSVAGLVIWILDEDFRLTTYPIMLEKLPSGESHDNVFINNYMQKVLPATCYRGPISFGVA